MPLDGVFHSGPLRLHYVDYGGPPTAPAVLLLHGLTGYARSWDPVVDPLLPSLRVFALDQRGHGDSDHAPSYGVRQFASDCLAFADHLRLDRFALAGLSLGARNAIAVGGAAPHRLTRLVLVDMAPEMAREGARRIRKNIGAQVSQVDASAGFATEQDAFAFQLAQAERPNDPRTPARIRAGIPHAFRPGPNGRLYFKYDPTLFVITGQDAVAEQPYLWESLARITCPTLVVRGGDSDILSPDLVQRMLARLPAGSSVEIAGAGHAVPYDQPEAFADALRRFLVHGRL